MCNIAGRINVDLNTPSDWLKIAQWAVRRLSYLREQRKSFDGALGRRRVEVRATSSSSGSDVHCMSRLAVALTGVTAGRRGVVKVVWSRGNQNTRDDKQYPGPKYIFIINYSTQALSSISSSPPSNTLVSSDSRQSTRERVPTFHTPRHEYPSYAE